MIAPLRAVLAATLALVLAGCTIALPVAPPASPTPAPAQSDYQTAETAYRILLERHVDKPSSTTLLLGATTEVEALLRDRGLGVPEAPAYTGDADADIGRFTAFLDLAQLDVDQADLERAAVNGMARGLNECHTYYLDPDRARSFNSPPEQYGGIGAWISQPDPQPGNLAEITGVFNGGPAERAGVRAGDRVKSVDGVDVDGLTAAEVANLIRGPEGTEVTIVVARGTTERTFTITRALLRVPALNARMEAERLGYVHIPQIVSSAPSELATALGQLESEGAVGWILDLRGNPGGDFMAAQLVASTFVEEGVLIYEVGREGEAKAYPALEGAYYPNAKPLAVLVSRTSASGAEIIASALQEHRIGRVFGERTAGCVGIGQPRELPDGGLLLVTVARMQSPVERAELNGVGVTPDEIVASSPDDPQDRVLAAAIAWLQAQAR